MRAAQAASVEATQATSDSSKQQRQQAASDQKRFECVNVRAAQHQTVRTGMTCYHNILFSLALSYFHNSLTLFTLAILPLSA